MQKYCDSVAYLINVALSQSLTDFYCNFINLFILVCENI